MWHDLCAVSGEEGAINPGDGCVQDGLFDRANGILENPASRKKERLQRVLFWVGVSVAFLALIYTFLGSNSFEQHGSIKAVALGVVALTLLVASKVCNVVKE